MVETKTEVRRIAAQEDALPYRFVGLERFAGWGQAAWQMADAVVPFVNGTEGDDTFTGTDADERYLGLGGNDTLSGNGGIDRLYGDEGNDRIDGGDGDDLLYGGLGDDVVSGGLGDDYVFGDGGKDRLYGGDGDDNITAGVGRCRLSGGTGDDNLFAERSELLGGAGNDSLRGANNSMKGGEGDDYLTISAPFRDGDDRIGAWGGAGRDVFAFSESRSLGRGSYVIHDLSNDDRIDLSGLDANDRATGDQSFVLVPEFDGHARQMTIRYDAAQDTTLIELYTNTDRKVDGTIVLVGNHLDFTDFVF